MTPWTTLALMALVAQSQSPSQDRSLSVRTEAALLADLVPEQGAAELRPRLSLSLEARLNSWSRLRFDARTDALAADRGGFTSDAIVRVTEGWVETEGHAADLRVGVGRLAWGRLDEVSPSDVVNPIDSARFLLEGRSEARLPVAIVRGRIFPSERLTIEGVLVPVFERGRFDELDEPTSPFNLANTIVLPAGLATASRSPEHDEPTTRWENMSGGGRALMTFGRVDVTALAFRGFDAFGPITFELLPAAPVGQEGLPAEGPSPPVNAAMGRLLEHHPRFTIVGADVETVSGEWAWRGEVVATTEKSFASNARDGLVSGRAFDAGAGVDRRARDYRVYVSALIHREWSAADPAVRRTDVNLVGSIERPFARDRYLVRGFAVLNPDAGSAFLRGVLRWQASDRASVEGSAGAFLGTSSDRIGQFRDRDFAFVKFSYDF